MADTPPQRSAEHAEVVRLPRDPFLARVEASRRRAPRLWRELEMLPYERQEAALFSDPRYRTWGLAELLAQRSIEAASRDPDAALNFAYLASNVPFGLRDDPPSWASKARIEQLLAYTLAHVANGLRVVGFLPRADHFFKRAFQCWKLGAAEPDAFGYRARVLDLQASLRIAQRRVPTAITLLNHVIEDYRQRDQHLTARAMMKLAKALEEVDRFDRALELLDEAGSLIDESREPLLIRTLHHNTAWCLATLGEVEKARKLLKQVRRSFEGSPESIDAARVDWIEARILRAEGHPQAARRRLERVRRAFHSHGLEYELAIVSLELAVVAAEEGDTPRVKRLAREVLPILHSQEVHRDAAVALVLFREAAFQGRGLFRVARCVFDYFRRSKGNPTLPFELPAQCGSISRPVPH